MASKRPERTVRGARRGRGLSGVAGEFDGGCAVEWRRVGVENLMFGGGRSKLKHRIGSCWKSNGKVPPAIDGEGEASGVGRG